MRARFGVGAPDRKRVRSLSIALLSWEYPPAVVGGLSRHVYELAGALASRGHRVTVYTGPSPRRREAPPNGARVVRAGRASPELPFEELVAWVLSFNLSMLETAAPDVRMHRPDVIHAHDWLVAHAARGLRGLTGAPIVATIHATEHGRHAGRIAGPVQRYVHGVESRLTSEAARVIACSEYMRGEVIGLFSLDPQKVETIPNEVSPSAFARRRGGRSIRAELGLDGQPLVLFAGRLEYEKGVQTLIDAVPILDRSVPGVRVVVAGAGSYRGELERRVRRLRLGRRVRFVGFVEEPRLRRLYRAADAVVVPSLYEPFGLVAVEAMASRTPVVAADTGGLREIVEDGVTGRTFLPGNARSLASSLRRVLADPEVSSRLAAAAAAALAERPSWDEVAERTSAAYQRAIAGEPAHVSRP